MSIFNDVSKTYGLPEYNLTITVCDKIGKCQNLTYQLLPANGIYKNFKTGMGQSLSSITAVTTADAGATIYDNTGKSYYVKPNSAISNIQTLSGLKNIMSIKPDYSKLSPGCALGIYNNRFCNNLQISDDDRRNAYAAVCIGNDGKYSNDPQCIANKQYAPIVPIEIPIIEAPAPPPPKYVPDYITKNIIPPPPPPTIQEPEIVPTNIPGPIPIATPDEEYPKVPDLVTPKTPVSVPVSVPVNAPYYPPKVITMPPPTNQTQTDSSQYAIIFIVIVFLACLVYYMKSKSSESSLSSVNARPIVPATIAASNVV